MKSRIPKNNENKGSIKVTKVLKKPSRGFVKQPPINQLLPHVEENVIEQYQELIKEYGENRKIEILNVMMGKEFFEMFQPCDIVMKRCVDISVTKLIKEEVYKKLELLIDIYKKEESTSEIEILEKFKNAQNIKKIKDRMPERLKPKIDNIIKDFIREKTKQIQEKELQKEEQNKESLDFKSQLIVKTKDVKEEKKQMSPEDKKFFEKVRRYTNNFQFLAEQSLIYRSQTGKKQSEKFDNFDQYVEFSKTQEMILNHMEKYNISEEKAIEQILNSNNDENKSLKQDKEVLKSVQRRILNKRMKVIKNSIEH